ASAGQGQTFAQWQLGYCLLELITAKIKLPKHPNGVRLPHDGQSHQFAGGSAADIVLETDPNNGPTRDGEQIGAPVYFHRLVHDRYPDRYLGLFAAWRPL